MLQFNFDMEPFVPNRVAPQEEYVRKGSSLKWLCYTAECPQCAKFLRLTCPANVEKFEDMNVVHESISGKVSSSSAGGVVLFRAKLPPPQSVLNFLVY